MRDLRGGGATPGIHFLYHAYARQCSGATRRVLGTRAALLVVYTVGLKWVESGAARYTRMPLARIASASSAAGPRRVLPVPSRTNSTVPRSGRP